MEIKLSYPHHGWILIVILVHICHVSLVGAFVFFWEANEQVRNELKNDRPCNFRLNIKDAHLLTPGIVQKYGYPFERHWVTTVDGYILEIHRIPPRENSKYSIQKRADEDENFIDKSEVNMSSRTSTQTMKINPAVFLMHGVEGSSRDFVINCERRALAFQLSNNGYDVYIGNARGNTYSRNHTRLATNDTMFWDFSADEIGFYDVPAMIDYILNTTKLKQVSYIGHSMGNGYALILLTARPEYNEKINIWFAMSAAVSLRNTDSPVLRIIAAFSRTFQWALTTYNHGELFPPSLLKFLFQLNPYICLKEGLLSNYHGICSIFSFIHDGYNPGQIPPELWSVLAGGSPAATSSKLITQWLQWIISGTFTMYDEGPLKNLRKYGTLKPKMYPVENLSTKTILMWGENDWIVSEADVRRTDAIVQALNGTFLRPNPPVEFLKIQSRSWNHLNFIYGKDADIFVYSHILRRLRLVYQNQE